MPTETPVDAGSARNVFSAVRHAFTFVGAPVTAESIGLTIEPVRSCRTTMSSGAHVWQTPAAQTPLEHTFPQPPQFWGSDDVSTHAFPQSARPVPQTHAPL